MPVFKDKEKKKMKCDDLWVISSLVAVLKL